MVVVGVHLELGQLKKKVAGNLGNTHAKLLWGRWRGIKYYLFSTYLGQRELGGRVGIDKGERESWRGRARVDVGKGDQSLWGKIDKAEREIGHPLR